MLRGITYISASAKTSGKRKETRKNTLVHRENNHLWLTFLLGIIIGTFFVNFFLRDIYGELGMYSDFFVDKLNGTEVKSKELFLFAFERRIKEILLIFLISITACGFLLPQCYFMYQGFSVGILISIYVLQYGIGGMFLYLLSIFPHYLVYVPMMLLMISVARELYQDVRTYKTSRQKVSKNKIRAYGKGLLILITLNVIVSYMETFLNIPLLTKILK